jgi:hypothetical protein
LPPRSSRSQSSSRSLARTHVSVPNPALPSAVPPAVANTSGVNVVSRAIVRAKSQARHGIDHRIASPRESGDASGSGGPAASASAAPDASGGPPGYMYGIADLQTLRGAEEVLTGENMQASLVTLLARFAVARQKSPGALARQTLEMERKHADHQFLWDSYSPKGEAHRDRSGDAGMTRAIRDQCCEPWKPTGPRDVAPEGSKMFTAAKMAELQREREAKRNLAVFKACVRDAVEFPDPASSRVNKYVMEGLGQRKRELGNVPHDSRCSRCFSNRHDHDACNVSDAHVPIVIRAGAHWRDIAGGGQKCRLCGLWGHHANDCRMCHTCKRWGHLEEDCGADFASLRDIL